MKGRHSIVNFTLWLSFDSLNNLYEGVPKFPDWVDNEIHAYRWYYSLRSNIKDYGGKTH
jgi:hypothetical protein